MEVLNKIKRQINVLLRKDKSIVTYNKNRIAKARGKICHAPFVSLRFSLNGNVLSCCYNREYILGNVAKDTLHNIWFGKRIQTLRNALLVHDFSKGCSQCKVEIDNTNYYNSGAINYDYLAQDKATNYPIMLDFEADNNCNYECIMCNGEYSSTILNVREKLPERKKVYEESFLIQLDEFIPHIREARFVGGEPFLIEMYIEIWEKIIALNANARISILTNGSVLNERIKTLLQKGNFDVSFSIDSLDAYNYNTIRKRGNLKKVLSNFAEIRTILISRDKPTSINTCLMRQNWQDIAEIVRFCNKENISIFFHTVYYPFHCSLWNLSAESLRCIIERLESETFNAASTSIQEDNLNKFADFVKQTKSWEKNAPKTNQFRNELSLYSTEDLRQYFTKTMIQYYSLRFHNTSETEEKKFNDKLNKVYLAVHPNLLNKALIELLLLPTSLVFGEFLNLDECRLIAKLNFAFQ